MFSTCSVSVVQLFKCLPKSANCKYLDTNVTYHYGWGSVFWRLRQHHFCFKHRLISSTGTSGNTKPLPEESTPRLNSSKTKYWIMNRWVISKSTYFSFFFFIFIFIFITEDIMTYMWNSYMRFQPLKLLENSSLEKSMQAPDPCTWLSAEVFLSRMQKAYQSELGRSELTNAA